MPETPPAPLGRPPARITLFTTPVLSPILGWFAAVYLKLVGWKTQDESPPGGGFVFVAAPHTSNWDAFYMLAVAAKERLAIHWLAKSTLFKRPFGWFFRWLGGIPVEKGRRTAVVDTAVAAFAAKPGMILGISPEGTRCQGHPLEERLLPDRPEGQGAGGPRVPRLRRARSAGPVRPSR